MVCMKVSVSNGFINLDRGSIPLVSTSIKSSRKSGCFFIFAQWRVCRGPQFDWYFLLYLLSVIYYNRLKWQGPLFLSHLAGFCFAPGRGDAMSETRKVYIGRLIGRCVIFVICLFMYLFRRDFFTVLDGMNGSGWDEFFQRVFPSAPFVGCVGGGHDPSDYPHQK